MATADVEPAAQMILRGGWGDRAAFLAWAVGHATCHPLVADDGGAIVGTGIATAYGRVGWVGTIFVDPARRRSGLGTALTVAVAEILDGLGCRTQVLIATPLGRPIYARLGFELLAAQVRYTIAGLPPGPPPAAVRAFAPGDLDAIVALDADATGEDRSAVLRTLATPDAARVLARPAAGIGGFVVRGPWGGAALVAPDPDDALALLEWRRLRAGPEGRVSVGLMDVNATGRARLEEAGWSAEPGGVRMIRGEPLGWRPAWLWGQFNGALG